MWQEVLSFCIERGCKDHRDRVFGVLALVKSSLAIPVDYSKQASEIWKQLIQTEMRHDHHLQGYVSAKFSCCAYHMYQGLGYSLYHALDLRDIDDVTKFVVGELYQRGGRPTCQHVHHTEIYDEVLDKIQQKSFR
jgi:hypothetical protein